jgi:hypothetical protein
MESNLQYYSRRSSEERLAAMRSANAAVRQIHVELARRYDERVATLSLAETLHLDITTAA